MPNLKIYGKGSFTIHPDSAIAPVEVVSDEYLCSILGLRGIRHGYSWICLYKAAWKWLPTPFPHTVLRARNRLEAPSFPSIGYSCEKAFAQIRAVVRERKMTIGLL